MSDHALLSASGAPKWVRCYGSLAMEAGLPNNSSSYADEGTAAHELADLVLRDVWPDLRGADPLTAADWVGHDIVIAEKNICHTVDFEMAEHVQTYVDTLHDYAGPDGFLQAETRVNYATWLGVPEDTAWGTSDAIIVRGDELIVCDLKYGAGVPVSAKDNEQLRLYALGSYNEVEAFTDIKTVRTVIIQPRIANGITEDGITEDVLSLAELTRWARTTASMAAQHALQLHTLVTESLGDPGSAHGDAMTAVRNELTPGEKQCRWCRAKAICPALAQTVVNTVANTVSNNFVDLDAPKLAKTLSAAINVPLLSNVELSEKMKAVPLIEAWLKDVRAAVEAKLFAGDIVPGYKIVQGKMGNRTWSDPAAALKLLKRTLGAKDAVKPAEVISAPEAEKRVAKAFPSTWAKAQKLITRSPGQPSVAAESDPREALVITPSVEAFAVIEDAADDVFGLI